MKRPDNISIMDWQLLQKKYNNLSLIIDKINEGYPIQYLIGNVDFYGYTIKINPNVLIPRFETETLVEKTLNYIKKLNMEEASLLEIGTGSGCISVALKCEMPKLEITAIDNSRKALVVAKENAKFNKVKINFIYKDLFNFNLINNYDIIISNPPYIPVNSNVDIKTKYEPYNAIFVEGNPLKYYEEILNISKRILNDKHLISFEIDEDYGTEMVKLAKRFYPKDNISLEKDLTGKDRYIFIFTNIE